MSVTIGGDTFEVYGSAAGLATYANGSTLWYATHAAASADARARALVEATRLLDRQRWQGAKVSDGQALAWPRSGVTVDGAAVSEASVPDAIVWAAYELALAILAKPTVIAGTSTGSNVQSVGAGPTAVTFFAPTPGARFPDRVQELIGGYLYGADGAATLAPGGLYATGTDGCSQFDGADAYGLTGPT